MKTVRDSFREEPKKVETMNDLFDLYEKHCFPEVTPRVRRDYGRIFNFLRAEFGERKPWKVKARHVVEFISVEKGKVHRNRMVMLLSAVFTRAQGRWCVDMDLVNPCLPVERHKTKPRERYINDQEFQDFRATAPATVQIAMDLALLTSQRQSDITQMEWSQVRMEGDRQTWEIWIDQGKTGKKLAIWISPSIEAVLTRAKMLEPTFPHVHVIRNQFGRAYTPDGFRALWQVYMRKWAAAGKERFHFHDIRAKAVSDNKNLQDASVLAGHNDPRITGRVYDRNRRRVMPLR